ncbi:MAG: hypothetical protein V4591_05555, partial [Bdellovibrionota bacterium]
LFGSELKNSPSPALHTNWFHQHGLNVIYLPCQIQEEKIFKSTLSNLLSVDNFQGANITMPFKSTVVEILNIDRSKDVLSTGVANTLYKNQSNKWGLENTDLTGIAKTIKNLIPENANYNLIVLGGGGVAASCLYFGDELDSQCQKILCFTRNPSKTKARFPLLRKNKKLQLMDSNFDNTNEIKKITSNKDAFLLVINTIPAENAQEDQKNNLLIQLTKLISINQICYFDAIYKRTPNIELAERFGIKCLDGSMMFEEQAKESFYLWTGIRF